MTAMSTTLAEPRPDDGSVEREQGADPERPFQARLDVVEPGRSPEPEPVSGPGAAYVAVERLAIHRTAEVSATDGWADAGGKVLRFHLSRMLARVAGTVADEDPEEVHAMRVAARRVRAAWRVFGNGFER